MRYFITTTNGHKVHFSGDDVFVALANTWTVATDGYAKRYYEKAVNGKRVRWVKYFHREIVLPKDGEIVDHINQNKLDNRRCNLRVASKSVNAINSSKVRSKTGYRGVCYIKKIGKYRASITIDKKTRSLGVFDNPIAASIAYLKAQKEATE